MKLRTLLILLAFACLPSAAAAQEGPDLFARIERAFREREPAWKVEQSRRGSTSDPLLLDMTFRSGRQQAAVRVTVWRREQDARDVFAAESLVTDNTRKRAVKQTVPNLGDENHMWTNRGALAGPTLNVRKGNVVVNVYTPTVASAKRFARLVLEQLEAGAREAAKAGGR